jgi:hypothetical protein
MINDPARADCINDAIERTVPDARVLRLLGNLGQETHSYRAGHTAK